MTRKLHLLSWLWMLSARLTAWIGRLTVRELGRRGLVATGWDSDGRLRVVPVRCERRACRELPPEQWPECNAFTVGVALGGHGNSAEA